ncbi:hypothetical protein, partial [Pseudomonas sp. ANT_J28]|uniref:hypothetical protein n=1 Tax=Pseudomonas sp. ANT_J28 TaxID=2597352 RepID=UPI001C49A580
VEVHFFDFCIGSHHEVLAPERVGEHSFEHQISTWNVGFMERLHFFDFCIGSHHEVLAPERVGEHSFEHQISTWNVGFMERLPDSHQEITPMMRPDAKVEKVVSDPRSTPITRCASRLPWHFR